MNKVLIFGFSGFVGPYLAKEFETNGYSVIGCDVAEPINNFFTFYKVDILDFAGIDRVVSRHKPDIIVNLAAISSVGLSWTFPQNTVSINVVGTLNILESVKRRGLKTKILLVGSSEEYNDTLLPIKEESPINSSNPYGISKITQELFAKLYRKSFGIDVFCVRAFNHTGIGQKDTFFLPSICKQVAQIEKSGKPGRLVVGNLNLIRDFCDVRDVVRAYRLIIEKSNPNIIYNVGSGKGNSLKAIVKYVVSLTKQHCTIIVDKNRTRPNDNRKIVCDCSRIKNDLGWEPQHELKETLKEMFLFFLK